MNFLNFFPKMLNFFGLLANISKLSGSKLKKGKNILLATQLFSFALRSKIQLMIYVRVFEILNLHF